MTKYSINIPTPIPAQNEAPTEAQKSSTNQILTSTPAQNETPIEAQNSIKNQLPTEPQKHPSTEHLNIELQILHAKIDLLSQQSKNNGSQQQPPQIIILPQNNQPVIQMPQYGFQYPPIPPYQHYPSPYPASVLPMPHGQYPYPYPAPGQPMPHGQYPYPYPAPAQVMPHGQYPYPYFAPGQSMPHGQYPYPVPSQPTPHSHHPGPTTAQGFWPPAPGSQSHLPLGHMQVPPHGQFTSPPPGFQPLKMTSHLNATSTVMQQARHDLQSPVAPQVQQISKVHEVSDTPSAVTTSQQLTPPEVYNNNTQKNSANSPSLPNLMPPSGPDIFTKMGEHRTTLPVSDKNPHSPTVSKNDTEDNETRPQLQGSNNQEPALNNLYPNIRGENVPPTTSA